MITFVFLFFIGMFAIAAVFISIMAKKRKDGTVERSATVRGDTPKVGRASGGDD